MRWKKGEPGYIPYDAIVDEALAFDWIDSVSRKFDERRSLLRISPRQPGSNWSAMNKARVEKLIS